jgi:hypothetical protein
MSQKNKRYDSWQRDKTINLVRSHLLYMDELTTLSRIFAKNLHFFQRLAKDCESFDAEDAKSNIVANHGNGEKLGDRITFVQELLQVSEAHCKRLSTDLKESTNTVSACEPSDAAGP